MTDQRFVGKAALCNTLQPQPARSLLQRNLVGILDQHQRELLYGQADVTLSRKMDSPSDTASSWAAVEGDRLWFKDEYVQKLNSSSRPTVTINCLCLRPRHSKGKERQRSKLPLPTQPDASPSWLPQSGGEFSIPCQIRLIVRDTNTVDPPLSLQSQAADLIKHDRASTAGAWTIRMQYPFMIDVESLYSDPPSHVKILKRRVTPTRDGRFSLEIGIHCKDHKDATELHRQLDPKGGFQDRDFEATDAIIWARCDILLEGSPSKALVELTRDQGSKKFKLSYALELDMTWDKQQASALASYGTMLQRRRQKQANHPVVSGASTNSEASDLVVIQYVYRHTFTLRSWESDSLRCVFCPKREHPSFDRLHLHYLMYHDHLNFEIEEIEGQTSHGLPRRVRITVTGKESSATVSSDKEMDWVAPDRPFDIAAYVRGDESWTSAKPAAQGKRGRDKREVKVALQRSILPVPRREGRIMPWEVPPYSPHRRTKHQVPRVSGVTFYRTTSKQAVDQGDSLSDSDNDVDDFWLVQNRRKAFAESGLGSVASTFHEAFNRHLDRERLTSDIFVSDAIVRFTLNYKRKLRSSEWKELFHLKVDQLHDHNIIDGDTASWCKSFETSDDEADELLSDPEDCLHRDEQRPTKAISKSVVERPDTVLQNADSTGQTPGVSIAHREIRCSRPAGKIHSTTVKELLKDDVSESELQQQMEIEPERLDFVKFVRLLDNKLIYHRNVDNIVCVSNGTTHLITDEGEWRQALTEAMTDWRDGPVEFQLLAQHELLKRLDDGSIGFTAQLSGGDVGGKPICQDGKILETYTGPDQQASTGANELFDQPVEVRPRPCVCEKLVNSTRGTIGCRNAQCGRKFHMVCINLQRRPFGWRCSECSS